MFVQKYWLIVKQFLLKEVIANLSLYEMCMLFLKGINIYKTFTVTKYILLQCVFNMNVVCLIHWY